MEGIGAACTETVHVRFHYTCIFFFSLARRVERLIPRVAAALE